MDQTISRTPVALPGIEIDVWYAIQNTSHDEVYVQTAENAPTHKRGAFRLAAQDPNINNDYPNTVSAKAGTGESIWVWGKASGSIAFDKAE